MDARSHAQHEADTLDHSNQVSDRFIDVAYEDFVADPTGTSCATLAAAGLPCTASDRARIAAWIADNPSHGHRIPKPSLAAWGVYTESSFEDQVAAAEEALAEGNAPAIGTVHRYASLANALVNHAHSTTSHTHRCDDPCDYPHQGRAGAASGALDSAVQCSAGTGTLASTSLSGLLRCLCTLLTASPRHRLWRRRSGFGAQRHSVVDHTTGTAVLYPCRAIASR